MNMDLNANTIAPNTIDTDIPISRINTAMSILRQITLLLRCAPTDGDFMPGLAFAGNSISVPWNSLVA
jgi:hypothetical protein